jgi:deoxyribodipyrimidine photo-lyase
MSESKILIYLMRRDLRLSDNPIFNSLSKDNQGFTHLLPLYVFPAQQVEVSGFIPKDSNSKSPYPEARSPTGSFWRCGPHRTKFLAESVWDLKKHLKSVDSDLLLRVGMTGEVVQELLRRINERNDTSVGAVWMTAEDAVQEKQDEAEVRAACSEADVQFKLWKDEKYLVDE